MYKPDNSVGFDGDYVEYSVSGDHSECFALCACGSQQGQYINIWILPQLTDSKLFEIAIAKVV